MHQIAKSVLLIVVGTLIGLTIDYLLKNGAGT
ncbi:hypothetical protein JOC54_003200 [Alkalihalobacillus xiaoxiensis]|uniref:Signal peptidase II n=1 Tax=Shouchella xiaoxiensis TaxID=766895 RepID=A0ABS2SWL2_9BACI|nr:hypothetical protein [Shouchella xiaoxiensis]